MTLRHNIFAAIAGMGLLASCSSDFIIPPYTVGEDDNAIVLRAGINEGGAGVATRAGVEDHHTPTTAGGGHTTFTTGTQLRLRVDGTWLGKANGTVPHGTITSQTVSQKTTATIGAETDTDSKHNAVTFTAADQLYWDDYGTADPANIDAPTGTATADTGGRNKGLTIYGAAIDSKTALPTTLASLDATQSAWTDLTWKVAKAGEPTVVDGNQVIDQTGGWSDYDLLVSNNVRAGSADGTYKFDDRASGKLLEFTHAMTKVTVNLTAGEGFPGYATAPANAKFQAAPTVTLLGFYYTGTVNVETKTSTPTTATTTDVTTYRDGGTAWAVGGQHETQFTSLVFPGNQFDAATDILKIVADGNTYYVNATKINAAMTAAQLNTIFEEGKNYVFNIKVDKTKVTVTATIKDWIDVVADPETPKINVTATYGYAAEQAGSTAFTSNYDLFRSKTKAAGYDDDDSAAGIIPAARYTSSSWDKTIYWPDHQTHYFFRGVYPQVGTPANGTTALTAEAVTTAGGNDVVAVANAAYTAATYPSDLAIAIPRKTDGTNDETCKESGHAATPGICATEGTINLNFEYAMSKVELRLKSSATGDGLIAMTKDNTKVEIIGGYSKARIKLSDGLHDSYSDADKSLYALSNLSTPESGFLVTSRDAIVPQEIGDDVKFRITVTTNDGGTPDDPSDDKNDVYECKVKTIKETSTSTAIGEWKPGKHYIYVLDINKTALHTTATLTDWETVTASDNVWF